MTVRLRVVLDRVAGTDDPDIAIASAELVSALVHTAPRGCRVAGIDGRETPDAVPAEGLVDVWRAPVGRRELAAAWRMGVSLGGSGGMIHSPSLMAPLVRHDRTHDHDQTVVTVWSLEAWTHPQRLDRADAAWQRAMLKRAVRFADAVVVPTHAMAAELAEIAPLGGRIRVIAGAPRTGFRVPADAPGRARTLGLPERYIAVTGSVTDPEGLASALRAASDLGVDVVMVGRGNDDPVRLGEFAQANGLSERRVHTPSLIDASDRAAVLHGALAVVAASEAPVFPWRALEALAVGAPLIAAKTAQNEELVGDGAYLTGRGDSDDVAEALRRVIEDEDFAARLRVLSEDRSRAFSWRDAAERVWQLHAEL